MQNIQPAIQCYMDDANKVTQTVDLRFIIIFEITTFSDFFCIFWSHFKSWMRLKLLLWHWWVWGKSILMESVAWKSLGTATLSYLLLTNACIKWCIIQASSHLWSLLKMAALVVTLPLLKGELTCPQFRKHFKFFPTWKQQQVSWTCVICAFIWNTYKIEFHSLWELTDSDKLCKSANVSKKLIFSYLVE